MKITRTRLVGAAVVIGTFVVAAGAADIGEAGRSGRGNLRVGMVLDYFKIDRSAAGGEEGISPHPPIQEANEFEKAPSVQNAAEGEDSDSSQLVKMLEIVSDADPSLNLKIDDTTTYAIVNEQVSYDQNQDTNKRPVFISEDGSSISVHGNTWRALPIEPPISAAALGDFVMSFEYSYAEAGELHFVCFEDNLEWGDYDDRIDNKNDPKRCIMLNQFEQVSNKVYVQADYHPGPRENHRYIVNLSKVFDRFSELKYLVLVLDNDAGDKSAGKMTLSNFHITTKLTSCLREVSFAFAVGDCTIENFLAGVKDNMRENKCTEDDPLIELMALYDAVTEMDVHRKIEQVCTSSYAPHEYDFVKTVSSEAQVVQEFIDGGTTLNYERDSEGGSLLRDGTGIAAVEQHAGDRLLTWPEHHALDDCRVGAAMCCWVDSRGRAPLEDNSDVCYVDMKASQRTAHVDDGWSIYGEEASDAPVNCHGFAWGTEKGSTADRLKGNALFKVGFFDGLYDDLKGNVEQVPGAPMCGCVDRMPVVTKAACTKVTDDASTVNISYDPNTRAFEGVFHMGKIEYEDCDKDLAEYYRELVGADSYLADYMDTRVVGDGGCDDAISDFLDKKGLVYSTNYN